MKKIPHIFIFAVVFALTVISCSNDDSTYGPSFSVSSISVPYEGGTFSVGYSVANKKDGGYVLASTEEDWISDLDLSLEDTLSFFVDEHFERVSRNGEVELLYLVGSDTLTTRTFRVTQEYYSYYPFDGAYASGKYFGMVNHYNNDEVRQYSLYISDDEIDEYGVFTEGATYYFFDFWTNADVEGTNFVSLPEGEYSTGQIGENWTISGDSQYFVMGFTDDEGWLEYSDQDEFAGGSLTVTRSGDITTISGVLEDYYGGTHDISYSGEILFENEGLVSSLDGDAEIGTLSNVDCEARYYGDYYQTGTANWLLCIYPEVGTGFVIDICAGASFDIDGGVPVGAFTGSTTGGVSGTFINGTVFSGYVSGTWLLSLDENGELTEPYAPIVGGTVDISVSEGAYTVTIDGVDDRENTVTGTWTGTPTISDCRTSTASVRSEKRHCLLRF